MILFSILVAAFLWDVVIVFVVKSAQKSPLKPPKSWLTRLTRSYLRNCVAVNPEVRIPNPTLLFHFGGFFRVIYLLFGGDREQFEIAEPMVVVEEPALILNVCIDDLR